MADCCLVPQIFNALRFGVDMEAFPLLTAIDQACTEMEAFKQAHPGFSRMRNSACSAKNSTVHRVAPSLSTSSRIRRCAEMNKNSFSKAAEKLFVAQPTLSRQLSKLEEEVGTPLFRRQARGVALTAAGKSFLRDAAKTLEDIEEAKSRA